MLSISNGYLEKAFHTELLYANGHYYRVAQIKTTLNQNPVDRVPVGKRT